MTKMVDRINKIDITLCQYRICLFYIIYVIRQGAEWLTEKGQDTKGGTLKFKH